MSKARFVQAFTVRWCPSPDKAEAVITMGEDIWDILTRRGYGAPLQEPKARERVDYYGRLKGAEQQAFDAFWHAYDYKKGKNEAAMVWPQVLVEEWPWAIASAGVEGRLWRENPPKGVTRIYAQGWLSAFRWRDHPRPIPTAAAAPAEPPEIAKARASLASYRHMQALRPSMEKMEEIERLQAMIAAWEGTADAV